MLVNIHSSKYHIWKPSLWPAKKAIGLTTTLHVHHAFFVHFFAVTTRLRRESALFHVLWRAKTQGNNSPFLLLKFDTGKKLLTFDELNELLFI